MTFALYFGFGRRGGAGFGFGFGFGGGVWCCWGVDKGRYCVIGGFGDVIGFESLDLE